MRSRLIAFLLIGALIGQGSAQAMGTDNPYLDAQTGLTYTVYSPTKLSGFKQIDFKLLPCATTGEEWIAVTLSEGKKRIEILQTSFDQRCSDPGISKRLADQRIGKAKAKLYVFCDPSDKRKYNQCSKRDIASVGGYLIFTARADSHLKRTQIQVIATGGATHLDLVRIASNLIPASKVKL